MAWTARTIRLHKEAAARLDAIMRDAFAYLGVHPRASEGETKDFILAEMKRHGIVMDAPFRTPIVGFDASAAEPHYFPVPGRRRLAPGTLVLIDIWGRLRGARMPYADITWMRWHGGAKKIPKNIQNVFDLVLRARDACLASVRAGARKGALPVGRDADELVRATIRRAGHGAHILHSTGHVLGFASPHGRGRNLNPKNRHRLLANFGYTIEPGVYLKGKFGVRSEMNFYVDAAGHVVVTTKLQRRLVII